MTDLDRSLAAYGARLEAVAQAEDDRIFEPALHRVPPRSPSTPARAALALCTVAAIGGVAALALRSPGQPEAPRSAVPSTGTSDASTATGSTAPDLPTSTSLAANLATSIPAPPVSVAESAFPLTIELDDDPRVVLASLSALGPTWLPDGAVEAATFVGDSRTAGPGGWAQLYVREADKAEVLVSSRSSRRFRPDGAIWADAPGGATVDGFGLDQAAVDQIAAGVTPRTATRGWNLSVASNGFRPVAQGEFRGPIVRRSWNLGEVPIVMAMLTGVAPMSAAATEGLLPVDQPRRITVRRADGVYIKSDGKAILRWSEPGGTTYAISSPLDGGVDEATLTRIAESLSLLDADTWSTILAGSEVSTEQRSTALDAAQAGLPKLLPMGLADEFTPVSVAVTPATPAPWFEQIWLSADTEDPPRALLNVSKGEALPSEGERIEVGGRRAAIDLLDGDGVNGLVVHIEQPNGLLTVLGEGLSRDELLTFAGGLKPRQSGQGYDATVPVRDLQLWSDGSAASDGGWSICWQGSLEDFCLSIVSGENRGAMFRPFGGRLTRTTVSGYEALLEDGVGIHWFLNDTTMVSLTSQNMPIDRLKAIAATVNLAANADWQSTWTAAGGA